jgi:4-coumarate--CoA ligase
MSCRTTGLPKGVCISHYNLIANVEQHIFIRDHKKPYESEPRNRPKERWVGFFHSTTRMVSSIRF